MNGLSFKRLLPVLITIAICLGVVWLLSWLLTRGIHRWGRPRGEHESPAAVDLWNRKLTKLLRRTLSVLALVVSTFVLLHGLGISGLPQLTWARLLGWVTDYLLPVIFIAGSGYVLVRFVDLILARLPAMLVSSSGTRVEQAERLKRAESVSRLVRWVLTATICLVTGLLLIRRLGVTLAPLLAGGTVVGAALGFGAQNLIKDVIAGFFLIIENQIRVGDVASLNGMSGIVEELHIRTIVLRAYDGTVYIVPNGSIKAVANLTKDFSYYVIDLGISYNQEVDPVLQLLAEIGKGMQASEVFGPKILAPLDIAGVDSFGDSAVMVKLRIKTVPREQWNVGRELNRRIKKAFDEHGFELPSPQLTVSAGQGFGAAIAGARQPASAENAE